MSCLNCVNEQETAHLMGMKDTSEIKCCPCQLEVVEKRTITKLMIEAHKTAIEHGWWDKERHFLELVALMHCELSEAAEAWRDPNDKEEHIVEEFADVLIRIFDLCGSYNWDLEAAVLKKMAFNKTRPYRHGGKLA